jgi:hypothetical protein
MRPQSRWFIVGTIIPLIGCASLMKTTSPTGPQVAKSTMDEACGNPVRWPISQECVNLLGPRGSLFQEKSDRVMAVWRACPSAAPCGNFGACKKLQSLTVGTQEYESQRADCRGAQGADYSCSALQKDPEFQRRGRAASECLKNMANDRHCGKEKQHFRVGSKRWNQASAQEIACYEHCLPGDSTPDCKQAQADLATFEDRVQHESSDPVLGELAPPQPIIVPPTTVPAVQSRGEGGVMP